MARSKDEVEKSVGEYRKQLEEEKQLIKERMEFLDEIVGCVDKGGFAFVPLGSIANDLILMDNHEVLEISKFLLSRYDVQKKKNLRAIKLSH